MARMGLSEAVLDGASMLGAQAIIPTTQAVPARKHLFALESPSIALQVSGSVLSAVSDWASNEDGWRNIDSLVRCRRG